jgi:hypothetical protein
MPHSRLSRQRKQATASVDSGHTHQISGKLSDSFANAGTRCEDLESPTCARGRTVFLEERRFVCCQELDTT